MFGDLTIHSNMPPHQDALSKLNTHSVLSPVKYCCTSELSITVCMVLAADLKVLELSELIFIGKPRLAVNLLKLQMNAYVVI